MLKVDHKICLEALAKQLEKVLPKIIHSDQAGFVRGHFIEESRLYEFVGKVSFCILLFLFKFHLELVGIES